MDSNPHLPLYKSGVLPIKLIRLLLMLPRSEKTSQFPSLVVQQRQLKYNEKKFLIQVHGKLLELILVT